ncbi:DUF6210 family protein [Pseudobacteroides cellulosolvens]|uniref:Uncharacterized protein n=1 Tax=Pseudobacteroides cellulosolvens ATCC 35603 = DSM 2933 TaxID=398512 RepID=A0A0L6JP88_9FIRM|nr:DUF6210 family protein [Pseudobacteroides cellulosolvens]KNY27594.1 hypothetical protein Bccel_2865 [Pseudobacteroides cellulosolvens ATCC 35603 = DSM 2933]
MNKKNVCLWGLEQLALIVLCKSGVEYFNQVGGNSCIQKSVEGILTIIFDVNDIIKDISQNTLGLMYLSEDDADRIDQILSKYYTTCYLSVDRERLKESAEAWIYVNIYYQENLLLLRHSHTGSACVNI